MVFAPKELPPTAVLEPAVVAVKAPYPTAVLWLAETLASKAL